MSSAPFVDRLRNRSREKKCAEREAFSRLDAQFFLKPYDFAGAITSSQLLDGLDNRPSAPSGNRYVRMKCSTSETEPATAKYDCISRFIDF